MSDRTGQLSGIDGEQTRSAPERRGTASKMGGLDKLWPYIRPYKLSVIFAFIGLVIAAGATLSLPVAVRRMIDMGFSGDNAGLIDSYFAMLLLIAAVLAGASAMRFYFVSWIGERVVSDIRASVFAHLTRLSSSFYERTHSAELMSRLTADTTQIKAAVSSAVSQLLRNAFLLIGALCMMVLTSATLSALVIGAIPLIVLPLVAYGRSVRRLSRQAQDELANASTFAAENLGSPTTMQAFTVEPNIINRYSKAVETAFQAARKRVVARAGLTATVTLLVFASIVGILWYGAHEVLTGAMTGGTLAQFVLYAAFAAGSVAVLSEVWGEIQQAIGAAERLDELLAIKPDITAPDKPVALPVPPSGEIVFQKIGFSYPGKPEDPVFSNLSFNVRSGERVAIVGPSGAGKTTIFNLLLRFYDPQTGQVLIDGVAATDADPADWRSRMSYVPQDPVVFATSIADNIAYGSPDATREQIMQAARMALADEFIEALPQSYDTILGERGITLSGGQRQRIAIARALLRDSPILLLDEATSALDSESEDLVQKALGRVMQNRTTLVIAHRLATVLNADRILVIDEGEIAEEGNHSALVARGGLYARLAEMQFGQEAGAA
ncbi:MAG: ATP-binding cassette domain-containing protein [Hyphomicrobiales bacterium]|nr:ATP-binding cassette domain-containing protein [Hyphomicrobiales bacterium]